jgi:hypothetical protein
MRESLEIIAGIRDFISSQNPMRFPHQEAILVDLLNELENILNPQPIEEPVIEEPVVEEPVIEEPIVEVVEEVVVEETVTEEPTVEVAAPKKTTRKKQ